MIGNGDTTAKHPTTENGHITVRVRLFAAPREALGTPQLGMEVPTGTRVSGLLARLTAQYPTLEPYVETLSVAVNRVYADRETELHDGDEVACLPPVAGG